MSSEGAPPPHGYVATRMAQRLLERIKDNSQRVPWYQAAADEEPEEEPEIKHLRCCGLPAKSVAYIQRIGVDVLRATEPGQLFERWLDSKKLVAVLTGVMGSGKTTLTALAMLRLTKPGFAYEGEKLVAAPVYAPEKCIATSAKKLAALNWGWSEDRPVLERLERIPLLVLDDLGRGESDPKTDEKLEDLLCERDGNLARTVITTNLSIPEVKTRYGPRVASRFAQEADIIWTGDVDHRRAQ